MQNYERKVFVVLFLNHNFHFHSYLNISFSFTFSFSFSFSFSFTFPFSFSFPFSFTFSFQFHFYFHVNVFRLYLSYFFSSFSFLLLFISTTLLRPCLFTFSSLRLYSDHVLLSLLDNFVHVFQKPNSSSSHYLALLNYPCFASSFSLSSTLISTSSTFLHEQQL